MATVEIVENERKEIALIKKGKIFTWYWMVFYKEWNIVPVWYQKNDSTLKDLKDAFDDAENLGKWGSKRIKHTLYVKKIRERKS